MLDKMKELYTEVMVLVNDHQFVVGVAVGVVGVLVLGRLL